MKRGGMKIAAMCVTVAIAAVVASSCGSGEANRSDSSTGAESVAAATEGLELPLPAVPDTLTDVEDRAAYIALHYWDAMDFGNVAMSTDTAVIEQNFANFAAIAELAPDKQRAEAVKNVLDRAATNSAALSLMRSTAERYLDDPNSPMRNEELYIVFLQHMVKMPAMEEADRMRAEYRLKDALKNRQGTVAADFKLTLRDGRRTTLKDMVNGEERMTLIVFYDPDCELCKEIMGDMARRIAAERVQIVAVDAEEDRNRWEETKSGLPDEWVVGYAEDRLEDEGMYSLPASPTMYLLDRNGIVVLKDPSTAQLYEALGI